MIDEHGGAPALALDADGRPAVCYNNSGQRRFTVNRFDGAAWNPEVIGPDEYEAIDCALAFAADGTLHTAQRTATGLHHSVRRAAGWETEMVAPGNDNDRQTGLTPSLRLDATGAPHITYSILHQPGYPFPNVFFHTQHYAVETPDGWQLETVDDTINARTGTLLLDGGRLRVVYRDRLGLALAERVSGEWQRVRLDRSGDVGRDPIIAFHGTAMRAGYSDIQNHALFYAAQTGQGWTAEVIDQGPPGGEPGSLRGLAPGPDGAPHAIFNRPYDRNYPLNYVVRDADGWQFHELADSEYAGPSGLIVDNMGRAHIATARRRGAILEYLPWTVPGAPGPGELIDSGSAGGERLGWVAGPGGELHAAYVNWAGSGVSYATRSPGGVWSVETIFCCTLNIVTEAVLALDDDGRPHVAYAIEGVGVVYATQESAGGPWQIDLTLPRTDWATEAALAVDLRGDVHLSYYDNEAGALIYALWDGSEWQWGPLELGEGEGMDSALALDPFGNPAIVYRAPATGDVMVAYIPADAPAAVFLPVVSR